MSHYLLAGDPGTGDGVVDLDADGTLDVLRLGQVLHLRADSLPLAATGAEWISLDVGFDDPAASDVRLFAAGTEMYGLSEGLMLDPFSDPLQSLVPSVLESDPVSTTTLEDGRVLREYRCDPPPGDVQGVEAQANLDAVVWVGEDGTVEMATATFTGDDRQVDRLEIARSSTEMSIPAAPAAESVVPFSTLDSAPFVDDQDSLRPGCVGSSDPAALDARRECLLAHTDGLSVGAWVERYGSPDSIEAGTACPPLRVAGP